MKLVGILLLMTCSAFGQWKVGMNFRSTSIYVSDGADEVYVLGETTSTERKTANGNSITFAWDTVSKTNRSTSYDVRLAGINYQPNGSGVQRTLTITLPQAGDYLVRLALGDALANHSNQYLKVLDTATQKIEISKGAGPGTANWWDASGTGRSAAAWPGSNTAVAVTFATTTCKVVIGHPTNTGDSSTLSHFSLEYVPAASSRRQWRFVQ